MLHVCHKVELRFIHLLRSLQKAMGECCLLDAYVQPFYIPVSRRVTVTKNQTVFSHPFLLFIKVDFTVRVLTGSAFPHGSPLRNVLSNSVGVEDFRLVQD